MSARFRVVGRLDGRYGGTVSIDRKTGVFSVRPYRCRRVYSLPLDTVAALVHAKVVKAEVAMARLRRAR